MEINSIGWTDNLSLRSALLRHPILQTLAKDIEQKLGVWSWFEIYSIQQLLDQLSENERDNENKWVAILLALFRSQKDGHISLDITNIDSEKSRVDKWSDLSAIDLRLILTSSGLVDCVSELSNDTAKDLVQHDAVKPLVLFADQLYFRSNFLKKQRVWLWSQSVAFIRSVDLASKEILKQVLDSLFVSSDNQQEPDWQKVAVAHALSHRLTVIAGGPGTGKTTTVAKLLSLLNLDYQLAKHVDNESSERTDPRRGLKVRLLAPTGKAAVRLLDSIRAQLKELDRDIGNYLEAIENSPVSDRNFNFLPLMPQLPETSETLHRFLIDLNAMSGIIKTSSSGLAHQLVQGSEDITTDADVIIVDEASMIDMTLMNDFISVIGRDTRVILMGDPYQLPPVELGTAFSDLVAFYEGLPHASDTLEELSFYTGASDNILQSMREAGALEPNTHSGNNPLVKLHKTYRFDGQLKIAAQMINAGDFKAFSETFNRTFASENLDKGDNEVAWYDEQSLENLITYLKDAYEPYLKLIKQTNDIDQIDHAFKQFQCLCSTYEGPLGARKINETIERHMLSRLPSDKFVYRPELSATLYEGKPILITKNQVQYGISNGDIGFLILQNKHFKLAVPQGSDEPLIIPIERLQEWQDAYAISVHKSQGSEYQRVSVVLADYAKELLSRPMLYTGLTRAKKACDVWGSRAALLKAFEA